MQRTVSTGIAVVTAALGMLALSAGALSTGGLATESPVDTAGAVFTDTTGQYSSQSASITQALEDANAQSNADVVAVVIDSFDGADANQWTIDSANGSGLSDDELLLVIAVGDGQYQYSVAEGYQRTDAQIDAAISQSLAPALDNGDLPGGITAFAGAIASNTSSGTGTTPAEPADMGSALGIGAGVVGGIAVLGGGAYLIARGSKKRKASKQVKQQEQQTELTLEQLKQRADVALVQLDDTVHQSEQELEFATAQFGADAVATYRQALDKAKAGSKEAFGLQQQLDDAFPDSDQDRHDWSSRILQIAEGASAELGSHAKGFEQLRDLEHTAPAALDAAAASRATLDQRIQAAHATLDDLDDRHSGSSLEAVRTNIAAAERLVPAIDEAIAHGRQFVTANQASQAALAVHATEASLAQTQQMLSAIDRTRDDLAQASEQLKALVDDTVADIATARSLPKTTTDLAPIIALAEQQIAAAKQVPTDTLDTLARLQRANQSLDEATGQVRSAADQQQRSASSLSNWLATARTNISTANDYIVSRRIGVGAAARQQLATAQQQLSEALRAQSTDAAEAARLAEGAAKTAQYAYELARRDINGGGDSQNPYYRQSGGNDMITGGLLGYILGSALGGNDHDDDGGGFFGGGGDGGFFGGGGGGGFGSGGGGGGGFFGGGGFGGGGGGSFGGGGGFSGGGSRGR